MTSTSENPVQRATRLAKELATALAACEDYEMAMVFPEGRTEYPVTFCLLEGYSIKMQRLVAYEKAYMVFQQVKEKPRSEACREARANLDNARFDLDLAIVEAAGGAS